MADIKTWSTAAASNNASPPDGFPENMFAADVNNAAREVMAAVARQYRDAQWVDYNHTISYVSATTFKAAGNVTAIYDPTRRIRAFDGGSTLYGEVTTRTFASPDTTVTVLLESGNLTSSLTSLSVGIISGENNASPNLAVGAQTFSSINVVSTATISGAAVVGTLYNKGALTQSGSIIASATMTLAGNAGLGGSLTVSGDSVAKGNLLVEGTTTLSGAVVATTSLATGTTAQVGTTLTVSGASALKGAVTLGSTLQVSGAVGVGGSLSALSGVVTGLLRIGSMSASATVVASSGRLADLQLTSNLLVAGTSSLSGTVVALGPLLVGGLISASGVVGATGGLRSDATLTVSGASILKSTLGLAGSMDHSATYVQSGGNPTIFLNETGERKVRLRMAIDQFQLAVEQSAGSGTYTSILEHEAEIDGRTRIRTQNSGAIQVDTEGIGLKNLYQPLAEVTLTAWVNGAATAIAHSLGRVPYQTDLVLRCTSATGGFAVGGEVPAMADGGHAGSTGLQVYADASLVSIAVQASGLQIANRTSVATMTPSTGAFNIVVKLY
jgi:hypothetical protein